MSASKAAAAKGLSRYGFARRWDLDDGDTLTVDLRDEHYNPYLGVSYVGKPEAGGSIVPEGHMGEENAGGGLDPDGWHLITLPSREDAITEEDGAGDVMVPCPLAGIRFAVTDAAAKVWLTLGRSPQGTPHGAGAG